MNQPPDPDRTVDETPRQNHFADGFVPQETAAPARLELLEEIARGGMGAIFRGRDADIGRDVAVKVLLEDHRGRPELAQRFLEEARIAGRLQHPGVVPVYALGRMPDGRPYFTMKLIKGRTLTALLAERKDPADDRPRFLAVFEQVCQTLAYAHARGVIHRDLKPANVMVGAYGEVQVMDWGLAKVLPRDGEAGEAGREAAATEAVSLIRTPRGDSDTGERGEETRAGTAMGTPAYMAPEQARGEIEDVGVRSDVFGLGAILCEVLTGRPPFAGPSEAALKRARRAELGDALGRLDGCGADAELIDLAKRCLAADPVGRPGDAGEVAAAVTAYRESVERRLRAAEVANAEARTKAAEGRKRRRLAGALAAVLLLTATAGGGVWGWVAWDRAVRRATAERAADVALGQAEQAAAQAKGIDEAADKVGDVEPETPETARRAAALWRQALGSVEEADRALAAAPDATAAARDRLAARRAAIEAGSARAEREARLLNDLDQARALLATWRGSHFDTESAARSYAAALDAYGARTAGSEGQASAAIRAERPAVRLALIVALDDWAACVGGPEAGRLRGVADGADDDVWRRRLRAAAFAGDLGALKRLAEEARGQELTAGNADFLAAALIHGEATAEAATLLRQARRQHPTDFWVHYNLGTCLLALSPADPATLNEAAGSFWTAIALRPDSIPAYVKLGLVLRGKGDLDGAAACLRKAIELDPKFALTHGSLGEILLHKGDLDGAAACLRKAIELDPKLAPAHDSLGRVLEKMGDLSGAVACYKKAIELDPNLVNARIDLGLVLQGKGDLDGAAACFKKAIELDPKNALAHGALGTVLAGQGNRDGAAECYRKAIELDPKLALAHYNLSIVLYEKGDLDGAGVCLRRAIELDPKNAPAHVNLGSVLNSQGDREGAAACYKKAIELDPKLVNARINLGLVLSDKGDRDGAAACYRKAIELDAKDAQPHNKLGLVLRDQGKLDEAIAEFREAVRLAPNFAAAHDQLGWTLRLQRKLDEALTRCKKAVELQPRVANYHNSLGYVLWDQGRLDEAVAEFREAVRLDPHFADASANLAGAEKMAALQEKLPALQKGEFKPRTSDELRAMAGLCKIKRLFLASARMYAAAFADDPKLADDLKTLNRYDAACYAACAAAGQGKDDPPPDETKKADLRRQALEWLRADLAAWTRRLDNGALEDRKAVGERMRQWQEDADLSGLRDPAGLAKLPAEEQEACKKLWADVQALLDKAEAKK